MYGSGRGHWQGGGCARVYVYTSVWHSGYLALNVAIKHKSALKIKPSIFKKSNVTY